MKHTNGFKPDTCGCRITFEWDDDVAATERKHRLVAIEKCPAHAAFSDEDAYMFAYEDMRRKNATLSIIQRDHPEICDHEVDDDGNVSIKFKKADEPEFSFDANRNLKIKRKDKVNKNFTVDESEVSQMVAGFNSDLVVKENGVDKPGYTRASKGISTGSITITKD